MHLDIDNLGIRFEDSNETILKDINLKVDQGEFVCIVGRSGCGKSTLLNAIAGLKKPTTGEIRLNGNKVNGPGSDRVVMFQENALFPWLNVEDNVKFGMRLKGISKHVQDEKCNQYLAMVRLSAYKKHYIHQLSGGMKQRIALARALTMDSEILLMDEPFSALDKQTSNHLREELQDIWMETGKTVLFITHSVEEAVYLGTKVVIMSPETKGVKEIIPIEISRPRQVYDEKFVNYRHKILDLVQSDL